MLFTRLNVIRLYQNLGPVDLVVPKVESTALNQQRAKASRTTSCSAVKSSSSSGKRIRLMACSTDEQLARQLQVWTVLYLYRRFHRTSSVDLSPSAVRHHFVCLLTGCCRRKSSRVAALQLWKLACRVAWQLCSRQVASCRSCSVCKVFQYLLPSPEALTYVRSRLTSCNCCVVLEHNASSTSY